MKVVTFDTETFPISADAVLPKGVCLSLATREGSEEIRTAVYGNGDDIEGTFRGLLEDPDILLVGHTTSYDLGVIHKSYPSLTTLIFDALEAGRVTCTRIREKLLNVSDFGKLTMRPTPDGAGIKLRYGLFDLAMSYQVLTSLEMEQGSQAKEAADAWRLHYSVLDGKSAAEYPKPALDYAADDARWTLLVYEAQELRCLSASRPGPVSMIPQFKTTAEDFALRLGTAQGIKLDPSKIEEVKAHLADVLREENLQLLVDSGILRPAEPPRPYKNQKEGSPVKMTKGKPASVNKACLANRVEQVAFAHNVTMRYTEPSSRYPEGQISTDSEMIAELAEHDPVLAQYQMRQEQQKVVQEINKLGDAERCYPNYDVVKETLRTSSYGNSHAREPLYPSTNIQQQDNRVRGIFIPDDGWVLGSCDFSALELISLAQTQLELFGRSHLAELLFDGVDPHAYLGAQLAFAFSNDFRQAVVAASAGTSQMDTFRFFQACKDGEEAAKKFYKHWRTFAKPVGLGFPGGLGAKTFVAFAKATYGVETTEEQAKEMKELWMNVFPEMRDFFAYINSSCVDPRNEGRYCYSTSLGFYRAGATYCAACNGRGLQSPGAAGAKWAYYQVQRAAVDPSVGSSFLNCKAPGFVHDEIVYMVPDDEYKHERSMEVSRIMVESLGDTMPDMRPAIKAEPALMRRWDKRAEPVYDERGRLTVWEPEK